MPRKNEKYDEAVKMYELGMSIQDCANFYGITRQAMWGILKRRGCQFRPQKRTGQDNHFYRNGKSASDRVHDIFEKALKRGAVVRKFTCEKCGASPVYRDGRTGIQAHHSDYNKPLDVQWLCVKCHHEWHKYNEPIQLKEELPKMTRKEISSLGGKKSKKQ